MKLEIEIRKKLIHKKKTDIFENYIQKLSLDIEHSLQLNILQESSAKVKCFPHEEARWHETTVALFNIALGPRPLYLCKE